MTGGYYPEKANWWQFESEVLVELQVVPTRMVATGSLESGKVAGLVAGETGAWRPKTA
jgi:hypothetical protein